MTSNHSSQTLEIASPAQTGIYSLFILAAKRNLPVTYVTVDASISTQPRNNRSFRLKTFGKDEKEIESISAEFTYIPHPIKRFSSSINCGPPNFQSKAHANRNLLILKVR